MRDPASHASGVHRVTAVETHLSWVFLTESHAYKLKKPARSALFDYTTLEARRRACETELRLNRRIAPNVYLAVVPVVRHGDGLRVEGAGAPVEWLVKMRRLPADLMLDARIAQQAVSPAAVDHLTQTLVRFYATAERAAFSGPSYRARLFAEIESKQRSLEQPRYGLRVADVQGVAAAQRRWLETHAELLEGRASSIVDAHGDLRPEHVCLEPEPVVIDCLDFDRDLRLLDPVSELSFLALECRRLGASWIGDRLLVRYAEATGDRPPDTLVRFYESYHAMIRAAVAVWHLDDGVVTRRDFWRERGNVYLGLARELV
ncbi:MAG TPA: hypothetical protein VHE30_06100 [Polyangiaceae bacterium]|nr:hypothetical protein [Polyangiaceae bacterium]